MAVGLFTDRRMLDHRVPARHPERPERLQAILRQLERTGYHNTCPSGPVREATAEELGRVHAAEYLAEVFQLEAEGGGMLDPDTWVLPGSGLAARLAAGAAIEAVSFVMAAPRPPGAVPGPSARPPRPAVGGHGLLHLRQRRRGRGGRARAARAGQGPDRRLRRPPRQRDPGDLLRIIPRRLPLDPPIPVLSRHRRTGRDRHGRRTRARR